MPIARIGDNQGEVGGSPTPADMFNALPIITRCWLGITVVLTFSVNFGIVSAYHTYWVWGNIKTNLEVYRFLTPFCYAGPFNFGMLILIYTLYNFSKQYEEGIPYNTGGGGGTADYAFCLLLGAIGCLVTYPIMIAFNFQLVPLFCENTVFYVLYIWSKKNPTASINIYGFPVQGLYLPFVLLALNVVTGQNPIPLLHGIFLGHVYYFMVDVIPVVYGKDYLLTPAFLINYFGVGEYRTERNRGTEAPARTENNNSNNNVNNNQRAGHSWGSGGNRLGTN